MKIVSTFLISALIFSGCSYGGLGMKMLEKEESIAFIGEAQGENDKSINELVYRGVNKAKDELKLDITIKSNVSKEKYEKNIRTMAQRNNLTIGIGRSMKDEIKAIANDMRDKNFAIVGGEIDLDNVQSISFKEEETAFLMGILAGHYTSSNKVGYIGGKREEEKQLSETGFAYGLSKINIDASEQIVSEKLIRYTEDYFNEQVGYEKAIELINEGCDIIFTNTGKSNIGVLNAASERNIKVIGNDLDYAVEIPEYSGTVIASVIKNIDLAVYETCKDVKDGTFKSGLNNKRELDLKSGLLGYSLNNSIENKSGIESLLDDYKEKVILKDIKIPTRLLSLKNI